MSGMPSWQISAMQFKTVDIVQLKVEIIVNVSITNPNVISTPVSKVRINIYFNDVQIGTAAIDDQVVTGKTNTTVPVTVAMGIKDLLPVAGQMLEQMILNNGTLTFKAEGKAVASIAFFSVVLTVNCVQLVKSDIIPAQIVGGDCKYGV